MINRSKHILLLYKTNQKEAFRNLFNAYYEPILMYCYSLVQNMDDAEDIVQDCFVQLWCNNRLDDFEGELENYLFKMVKLKTINFLRDAFRREQLHQHAQHDQEEMRLGKELWQHDDMEKVYQCINQLPEQCRKIFLMASVDELKYREIAEQLGVSVNTVKTQMKIALKSLRSHLSSKIILSLFF